MWGRIPSKIIIQVLIIVLEKRDRLTVNSFPFNVGHWQIRIPFVVNFLVIGCYSCSWTGLLIEQQIRRSIYLLVFFHLEGTVQKFANHEPIRDHWRVYCGEKQIANVFLIDCGSLKFTRSILVFDPNLLHCIEPSYVHDDIGVCHTWSCPLIIQF